eukprot:scaffold374_cov418-Pavlova_lutheri.AAC.1
MAAQSAIENLDRDGVPELNPTNWPSWSFKMMNCLEILDLWEYVEEEPHMLVDEGGNLTTESQELAKMVRKARSRILMSVSSRYRGVLKHCTTAKQVWDKLECFYKDRSQSRLTHLKRAFNNVMMEQGEDVDNYINRVANLVDELNENGAEISEVATCTAIVAGLPPSYKHLMHILDNQTCTFTIESVRNSILRFDATESLGKGLSAVTLSDQRPKPKKFCSFCKKYGHVVKNCWTARSIKKRELQEATADQQTTCKGDGAVDDTDGEHALSFMAIAVRTPTMQSRFPHVLGKPLIHQPSRAFTASTAQLDTWIID